MKKYLLLLLLTSCSSTPEMGILEDVTYEKIEPVKTKNIISTARKYEVSWVGIHVADFIMEITPTKGDVYFFKAIIRTYGLANMISGFQSNTFGKTNFEKDAYKNASYDTSFYFREKRRDIKFSYSHDGTEIIEESNFPPEKRWKRKEVPKKLKDNTFNPLSIVFTARQKIINGVKKFSLPLYDGRRRSDILFTVYEKKEKGLIHISFKEKPISGYTDNEMKDFKEDEKIIHMYISPDNFLPVKAEGRSSFGTANIKMIKECNSLRECWQ